MCGDLFSAANRHSKQNLNLDPGIILLDALREKNSDGNEFFDFNQFFTSFGSVDFDKSLEIYFGLIYNEKIQFSIDTDTEKTISLTDTSSTDKQNIHKFSSSDINSLFDFADSETSDQRNMFFSIVIALHNGIISIEDAIAPLFTLADVSDIEGGMLMIPD